MVPAKAVNRIRDWRVDALNDVQRYRFCDSGLPVQDPKKSKTLSLQFYSSERRLLRESYAGGSAD